MSDCGIRERAEFIVINAASNHRGSLFGRGFWLGLYVGAIAATGTIAWLLILANVLVLSVR